MVRDTSALCPLQRARLAFRARTALRECASILLCRRHSMPRRRPLRDSVCASRPLCRHAAAGIASCPLAGGPSRQGLLGTRPAPFGELCKPFSRFTHIPPASLTLSVDLCSKISNARHNGRFVFCIFIHHHAHAPSAFFEFPPDFVTFFAFSPICPHAFPPVKTPCGKPVDIVENFFFRSFYADITGFFHWCTCG